MANAKTKAEETNPEIDQLHTMVTIIIPRTRPDEEDVEVQINNHKWTIKRGVHVQVPLCVAEMLENKQAMMEKAYQYEASLRA